MAIATIQATSNNIEVHLDKLATVLPEAGRLLRVATLSLRAAYSVSDSSIPEFIELRSSITNDANAYRHQILPVAKVSATHVMDFMEYFLTLDMDAILAIVGDITKEARHGQQLMSICKDMHMTMSVLFKRQQDKIAKVLSKCRMETEHYQAAADRLRESAKVKDTWACALCFIPVVNLIATPLLANSASDDLVQATVAGEEAQLAVNATFVIKDCLVGAIADYVEAMGILASTFQMLANEIEGFLKHLDKLSEKQKSAFLTMCRAKAKKVSDGCGRYTQMTIEAETDLASLPEPQSQDINYVQQWLAQNPKKQPSDNRKTFKEQLNELGEDLPKPLANLVR